MGDKLIFRTSLTACFTVCPKCCAVNKEKFEYIQEDFISGGMEVYSCTACGATLYGVEEKKSAKLKAVDWFYSFYNIDKPKDRGLNEEEIKKAIDAYNKAKGARV